MPATNLANFAYAFDRDTSPAALALLHVNAGHLATSGDPRGWVDGGVTSAADLADGFAQEPANGVEWYFPLRLTIDTNGANRMKQDPAARYLGLRLTHTNQINVPIYAFQSDLTDGAVLRGAKRLVKRARTTKKQATLVNGDPRLQPSRSAARGAEEEQVRQDRGEVPRASIEATDAAARPAHLHATSRTWPSGASRTGPATSS